MKLRAPKSAIAALCVLACQLAPCQPARAELTQRFGGYAEGQLRAFAELPSAPAQYERYGVSLALKPEWQLSAGRSSIDLEPFVRVDQRDPARTHFDLRRASWSMRLKRVRLRLGAEQVFWGVLESKHLVDVVNQIDALEDLRGEAKLGQPMAQLTLRLPLGTLDVFLMSGFRPRRYPGIRSRLRFLIPIREDLATYASPLKRSAPDAALRWAVRFGELDLGLSYFYGTSRDPRLAGALSGSELVLVPRYDRIHQGSLDAQWTVGPWLLKAESLVRQGQAKTFAAVSAGVEYSLVGALGRGDLSLLAEYHYDGRSRSVPQPLQNDGFAGIRLAFNDPEDTTLTVGGTADLTRKSHIVSLELERRWGETRKVSLEGRAFVSDTQSDVVYSFRNDAYLQASLQWFL